MYTHQRQVSQLRPTYGGEHRTCPLDWQAQGEYTRHTTQLMSQPTFTQPRTPLLQHVQPKDPRSGITPMTVGFQSAQRLYHMFLFNTFTGSVITSLQSSDSLTTLLSCVMLPLLFTCDEPWKKVFFGELPHIYMSSRLQDASYPRPWPSLTSKLHDSCKVLQVMVSGVRWGRRLVLHVNRVAAP